ncbi:MAG: hypothetical protein MJ016_00590 [Victivallaceae bacterium]|nr:hypothetical protein [Victivallaceae bacterium]
MLWEPVGILFLIGMIYFLVRDGKKFRDLRFWFGAAALCAIFFGRVYFHITPGRYYSILVFPALFFLVYLLKRGPWHFLPEKNAKLAMDLLFAGCLLAGTLRCLYYNPQEKKIVDLCSRIKADAAGKSVIGLAYTSRFSQISYYSGVECIAPERPLPLSELLIHLRGNLSVYDGDFDAVYWVVEVKKNETLTPEMLRMIAPPERFGVFGGEYLDRHRKKKLVVLRYLPLPERQKMPEDRGELVKNGDFSKAQSEKDLARIRNDMGKRMTRLQTEKFVFPAHWVIECSLAGKNNSFASVVERGDTQALRVDANGYVFCIVPSFPVETERTFSFHVKAERDAVIQISRNVRYPDQSLGLHPFYLLFIKAGKERDYRLQIPAYSFFPFGELYFWIQSGTVEISDVRVK